MNDRIVELVDRGLDDETQQALDAVRVIGNRAVHGEIWAVADDDELTVATLFRVVNRIAETLADRPKRSRAAVSGSPVRRTREDRHTRR